jgi:ribosomal protein S18 acetylase RimI-like enzyme
MAVKSEVLFSEISPGSIRTFDARRDMASVADLIELCFSDTLDQDGKRYLHQMRGYAHNPSLIQWAPISSEWSGSPFLGYVWEASNQIIGNISLIPFRVNGRRRYMIANVAVHPEHRRTGIATNLTKQALHHARSKGADCTWLQVREDNPIATKLYQNLGFIERTRRSTWYGKQDHDRTPPPPGAILKTGNSIHWLQREQWLRLNYPVEYTWQLPFKYRLLSPGVFGALSRFFSNVIIQTWSIIRNSSLEASVSWQYGSTVNNYFWLAAPDNIEESTLTALLKYARPQVPRQRQLVLDFPAQKFHEAISASGFVHHQTLIWMEYNF